MWISYCACDCSAEYEASWVVSDPIAGIGIRYRSLGLNCLVQEKDFRMNLPPTRSDEKGTLPKPVARSRLSLKKPLSEPGSIGDEASHKAEGEVQTTFNDPN